MGSLTEYHYNAAFKAYYARGLLYAERLVHGTNASPWALCHRAYARMQAGLHKFAADDIAAAKKKQGDSSAAMPLPFWTKVLDAFGQGDLLRMLKVAETPPQLILMTWAPWSVAHTMHCARVALAPEPLASNPFTAMTLAFHAKPIVAAEARAQMDVTRAGLFPNVSLSGSYTRQRTSANTPSGTTGGAWAGWIITVLVLVELRPDWSVAT